MEVRKQLCAPALLFPVDETVVSANQEGGWTPEMVGTLYRESNRHTLV
jgi:hypothetical protein